MALYLTTRIKNIIVLSIIAISLIISVKRSRITESLLNPHIVTASAPEKAVELFKGYNYNTKLDLRFVANDISKIKNKVDSIIYNNQLNVIYSIKTNNNITELVEIPADKYPKLLHLLRNSPGLVSDELTKSGESASVEDLEKRISDTEKIKERIIGDLSSPRISPLRANDLNAQLGEQNNVIDSLKKVLKEKEQSKNYILAKIDISSIVKMSGSVGKSFKTFGITFVETFVFTTIALLICYLIIIVFSKLFTVLKIKTSHGSGSRYGQYGTGVYGYGDYNYGGYGGYGERRIKRKYIKKPKPDDEESESTSKDQKKENNH